MYFIKKSFTFYDFLSFNDLTSLYIKIYNTLKFCKIIDLLICYFFFFTFITLNNHHIN